MKWEVEFSASFVVRVLRFVIEVEGGATAILRVLGCVWHEVLGY
jgi:hypothetical protein